MAGINNQINKAEEALNQKDYALAITISEGLLKDNPEIGKSEQQSLQYILGVAKFRMAMEKGVNLSANIDEAIRHLGNSLNIDPENPDANVMMGTILLVKAERENGGGHKWFMKAKDSFLKAASLGSPWPSEYCRPQIEYIDRAIKGKK